MFKTGFGVLAVLLLAAALGIADDKGGTSPEADAAYNAGLGHLNDGRTELAIEQFKRAISKANKGDASAAYYYSALGKAQMRRGAELGQSGQRKQAGERFKEAEQALRKALEIHPYYVDVHNDLALALIYQDRRSEGKKEWETAFADAQNPNPEQTAYNLGQANFEEKNYKDAASWFQTSIKGNASFCVAYQGLADTQTATGRADEACATLENGAKACQDFAQLQLAAGECHLKKGRLKEARERLEQAAKKDTTGAIGQKATELLGSIPTPVTSPR